MVSITNPNQCPVFLLLVTDGPTELRVSCPRNRVRVSMEHSKFRSSLARNLRAVKRTSSLTTTTPSQFPNTLPPIPILRLEDSSVMCCSWGPSEGGTGAVAHACTFGRVCPRGSFPGGMELAHVVKQV
jgi:hypothetical protein